MQYLHKLYINAYIIFITLLHANSLLAIYVLAQIIPSAVKSLPQQNIRSNNAVTLAQVLKLIYIYFARLYYIL